MTETYRKLDETELRRLAEHLPSRFETKARQNPLDKQIIAHVQKYYPAGTCSAVLTINSEYNDEGYNCSAGCLVVYDRDGEEMLPTKATASESRKQWQSFNIPDSTDENPPEDRAVLINAPKIPDLYIKE